MACNDPPNLSILTSMRSIFGRLREAFPDTDFLLFFGT
jgi:hypothetical protein